MRFRFSQLGVGAFLLGLPWVSSALTESGLTVSPYLQRVSKHAATVMARSEDNQTLDLYYRKVGATNWKHLDEDDADTRHRYRLTSLKKNTNYEYYLRDSSGNHLTQTYDFTTRRDITNDQPLRVAVFGDSGVNTTTQYEVASEMAAWKPELLLHTGDIAYDSGTEQELIDTFFTVYSSLLPEIPFYGSIGNHEYTTEEAGPYKEFFETPQNGEDEDYYSFNFDTVHFVSLNSNLDYSVGSDMYTWLENDLDDANKKWKVVFFHHPVYSSSSIHGSTAGMAEALVPLFEEYNVDLVLNGHDHDYERFEKMNGVTYVVTGGGGNTLYAEGTEEDNSALFVATYHFVGLTIDEDAIELEAVDKDGFVFDEVTIR